MVDAELSKAQLPVGRKPGVAAVVVLALAVVGWGVGDLIRGRGTLYQGLRQTYRQVRGEGKRQGGAAQAAALTLPRGRGETPHPAQTEIAVEVDVSAGWHPISPYIYGMAAAPKRHLTDLRLGLNRWGGNDKSRYNWVHGDATNAARDWYFANRPAGMKRQTLRAPSSAADQFVSLTRSTGAATLLTIPTLGWVARDANIANRSVQVPAQGGEPLPGNTGSITGYNPASNRRRTSVRSVARKKAPFTPRPALRGETVYQDEWVHHLTRQFGRANAGGVRFFAMDNEPDLWDTTHTDVHPARPGYDELRATFLEYARAVKAVDPDVQITGPVSWGWIGYQYAPLDRGDDNFRTHADRKRHGDKPFLLWFLEQVRRADRAGGKRTLDVLDVHYYPQGQGLFPGKKREEDRTRARRIRATRSLWDPSYVDESWIGEPVRLLPRLKEWIASGYPGTRIGITEWNWGGNRDISGGLAAAETLGVFGRDGVYLANFWAYPPYNSPVYLAFKLFRNADGRGHGFGDQSCQAQSAAPELVSCFAATEKASGALTLVFINKMPQTTASVRLRVKGWRSPGGSAPSARVWRMTSNVKSLSTQTLPLPGLSRDGANPSRRRPQSSPVSTLR